MTFNISVLLRESAAEHPDRPCVILGDRAWIYAEVDAAADLVAQRAAGRALRVGGQAHAATIALVASSQSGDQKGNARETEDDGFSHGSLPVLWDPKGADRVSDAGDIARQYGGRN